MVQVVIAFGQHYCKSMILDFGIDFKNLGIREQGLFINHVNPQLLFDDVYPSSALITFSVE